MTTKRLRGETHLNPKNITPNTREYRPKVDFTRGEKMVAVVNKDECVGCGVCVDACPNEAIKMVDDIAVIEADLCIDCEACVGECPNSAISMQ